MKKALFAIIGLYLLIYILPLGFRPLFIPDETRYMEIPREMIASGDWIVPRLDGIRYFEKPVLGYWCNALSMMVFGENAFAVRLPSAISAGICGLVLFLLGGFMPGGRATGLLTAVIFLTSLQVFAIGTFCVLDNLLAMLLTVALALFFFSTWTMSPGKKKGLLFLFGMFCGLAFLAKGFLAFAVPVLTAVPFMIWEKRFKELSRLSWLPIIGALVVSLPWSISIHFAEPDFWRYFFWVEHVQRFLSPGGGQHPAPFWFFIPVALAGTLPWSCLLPGMVKGFKGVDTADSLIRFSVCWFLFPFLFFSASSGKLPTYILPCLPPLVILMAAGLRAYLKNGTDRAFRRGTMGLAGVIGVIGMVLALSQITGLFGIRLYQGAETWKWVLLFLCLGTWSAFSLRSFFKQDYTARLTWFALAPCLLFSASPFLIPGMTLERKTPGILLERNQQHIGPETVIVSDGDLIRAVTLFYKRNDVFMFISKSELKYGLSYKDARDRMLDTPRLVRLIRKDGASPNEKTSKNYRVALIARANKFERVKGLLPKPAYSDQFGKFLFIGF